MAAGIEPGVTDEGRATRGVVGAMSGAAAYSDQAPQGADGVVVTCGGKGTGRLITGTGHSVVFHCGAIVDTPLASTDRTLTIELEDDTYWTLAYYEGAPPTK
ncbi:hypothetical protein [Kytococcus sedentarius]|uniref:hypothetical protein n=1 Tax=Kytococcus sedentarius TaxID=1276 RepID=UPI0035BBBF43